MRLFASLFSMRVISDKEQGQKAIEKAFKEIMNNDKAGESSQ